MNTQMTDSNGLMGPGSAREAAALAAAACDARGRIRIAFERGRELRGLQPYRDSIPHPDEPDTKPEGEEITDFEFAILARWDSQGGLL